MTRRRAATAAVALALGATSLAACGGSSHSAHHASTHHSSPSPTSSGTPSATARASLDADGQTTPAADDRALDPALSQPVHDSVYPDVGDPGVDALHYGLVLAWTPTTRTLDGDATIELRSTADADRLRLDLGQPLKVTAVTLDQQKVAWQHTDEFLDVNAPVNKDGRYTLDVHYSGTPEPVKAPTSREDLPALGWTITPDGETWTMQEPFGAYSWYPVDDQPSDKAFYDISITAPSGWTGIANGQLQDDTVHDGLRTTRWHLDQPASSYLVTVAVGDYVKSTDTSKGGVPITYWTPADQPALAAPVHQAAGALDWVEKYLGPFPFASLGFVLVDSTSGMETQTMITLGSAPYDSQADTLAHEIVHQWYGDEVTPGDWSDLWMNEGMAMYLQFMYQAHADGKTMAQELAPVIPDEARLRAQYGPPAAYDKTEFAESNVYYGPALMYQDLRQRIGDQKFFALIKAWPAEHADTTQSRSTFLPWLEQRSGLPASFFDAWLLGTTSPQLTVQG